MLTKQDMNIIERLREHRYECTESPEGVIINSKMFGSTHDFIDHQDQGSQRTRTMIAMIHGIGQSNVRTAREEATKALKLIEVFINDHYDKGEENLELSRARDCIIEVIEKTTSIEKDNESIKWINEDNQ